MSAQTLCDICHEPIVGEDIVRANLSLRTAKKSRDGTDDFHPECLKKVLPKLWIFSS